MQYYCDIDHLLSRVKKATLSVLTEGSGGDVGEEVAELVLRDASAEVDMYLTITTPTITEALAGLTADIAVFMLYFRAITFGAYNEATTTLVTNNLTDARDATTTVGKDALVTSLNGATSSTESNVVSAGNSVQSATTVQVGAPQTVVVNSNPTANTVTVSRNSPDATDTTTTVDDTVTVVNDDLRRTGTVSTTVTAAKTITEIPQSVTNRYNRAMEMLQNTRFHARLLGYGTNRSSMFASSAYASVSVLENY